MAADETKDILLAAVQKALTGEVSSRLVDSTVAYLLTNRKGTYGEVHPSPVESELHSAAVALIREQIKQSLASDPRVVACVREACDVAKERLVIKMQERLAEDLATAMYREVVGFAK